jgi:dipeptidase E
MGKIVAIGGGELSQGETMTIDKYLVNLSFKEEPRLLFIPTASNDAEGYIQLVEEKFSELGCIVDSLCLATKLYTEEQIRDKVLSSDIIYVGGGDTLMMMKHWRKNNLDMHLKEAYSRGIVLSGISAGSICWFNFGNRECGTHDDVNWEDNRASGLGLIRAGHCPHYDAEGATEFDDMMKNEVIPGIALEDKTAFVVLDEEYYIVKSDSERKAYIIKSGNNDLVKEELEEGKILNLTL